MVVLSGQLLAEKKIVRAARIDTPPIIDGVVDEAAWDLVQPAVDWYKLEPVNGGPSDYGTEMRFLYDDVAFYVSATMYDDPANIKTQLGKRDDEGVLADWVGIWFSPFNDGANDLNFSVTAAGVQIDAKYSPNNNDSNWDPVWESAVTIHAEGWSVEMAIPFSQIRFPSKDVQVWGMNMARYVAKTRQTSTWNFIDNALSNFTAQAGILKGIEHVETPLRLSFTPYASTSFEHYPFDEEGKSNFSRSIRGGMDMKYGINESFTLDLTLIPDFGQVQSDNEILNLSPFEVRYDEKRPFFTEGTEQLNKGGLFYSRRVGSRPLRYGEVEDLLEAGEEIKDNPDESQMINATKITGQTVNGVGLGFFNALTGPMHAVIRDSLGHEREYLTNPLTNYNLVVLGKNLKNGSEINLINTNVQRFADEGDREDFWDANVTGLDLRLTSKNSKWILDANAAYNRLSFSDSISTGHQYNIELEEEEGIFQYGAGVNVESEFYDPNDMGYIQNPNEISTFGFLDWRTINPIWKVNHAYFSIQGVHSRLFKTPRDESLGLDLSSSEFSNAYINLNYNVTFRNYFSTGGGMGINPVEGKDFFEPRVEGRFYRTVKWFDIHQWISTNFNKPLAISAWIGTSQKNERGAHFKGMGFDPRWRVNNQLLISYGLDIENVYNGHGYAEMDSLDNSVFGRRDRKTIINTLYTSYIFSPDLESDIRMRYYRAVVDYHDFYDLGLDGNLSPRDYAEELDYIFGVLTIDALVTWRFSPGSELKFSWKNAIYQEGDDPERSYFTDVKDLTNLDQSNSISVKLLYYVDAWDLKHRFN
ncbi:MAG: carbohydrate binding family 9 domain-containing protein [Candidatus Marinimicrobia bacterium]|nr:carbohydrate binding family 9 domain-containing protein [Candidatus Neomarinimicrobiota bacterium]MCF7851465.1 carbohydrate binding family 9 domain-containing protein [Candidatus Neomarinimicrobiota bacterium]MCF7904094.1 carbohydrate binding family 9 domain-containing protein [Candidatus Neomarinimicrobiota bacterium]